MISIMMINNVLNEVKLCYAPLTFSKVSSVSNGTVSNVEIYPNPATDVFNIIVKDIGRSGK